MDIRNCKRCGRIYTYDGFNFCRSCRKNMEEEFEKVKAYLRKYPGASVSEVESETGVDSETIMNYVRDGRLEMDEKSAIEIYCEKCGTRILSGRYCASCSRNINDSLVNMARSLKKDEPVKPLLNRNKGKSDESLMQRGSLKKRIKN